jgi:hypothetical protein
VRNFYETEKQKTNHGGELSGLRRPVGAVGFSKSTAGPEAETPRAILAGWNHDEKFGLRPLSRCFLETHR